MVQDGGPPIVDCYYKTSGGTSANEQCFFVTPEAALDVLTISQHVGQQFMVDENTNDGGYTLAVTSKDEQIKRVRLQLHPMEALRSVAVNTILQEFQTVVQSDSFASQLDDPKDAEEGSRTQELLLEMCLYELSSLPSLLQLRAPTWAAPASRPASSKLPIDC